MRKVSLAKDPLFNKRWDALQRSLDVLHAQCVTESSVALVDKARESFKDAGKDVEIALHELLKLVPRVG